MRRKNKHLRHLSIFAFFWHHIRPYKWLYALMLLAPIVSSFFPFASNYATKLFLDVMEKGQALTYENLLTPILLFLGAQVMLDIVWRISQVAEWKAEPYVRRSILLESYDYVQHHAYQFFQDNFTGAISSKLKGLLSGYDNFWAEMHHGLMQRVLKSFVGLCALAWVNAIIAGIVLGWMTLYLPLIYHLSLQLNRLASSETDSQHELIGGMADKVTNIWSIFSFATRQAEVKSLNAQISTDFVPKQIAVYKYDFKIQILTGLLYCLMFTTLLFVMIHLRRQGQVSMGDFAFVFGMTLSVAEDVWHATVSLQDFARTMGDLNSTLSILRTPQKHLDFTYAKPLIMTEPRIVFQNICFEYEDKELLFDHLNLTIQPSEKVGLVGHSGSGKSSLVNLLLRYFHQKSGDIMISDQDVMTLTQDSIRSHIAVIPQDTLLFHRTLMENIRYGNLNATDEEVIYASKKAHVHEFIMTLPDRYDTYVGERGMKLSGGQRQRISIARAILKDAPILVLDEATASLDSQTERLIQESLDLLMEDKKKTVIAIAHRLSTLKHMDRILVLDHGRIVEEGTHEQLIHSPQSLYKKLWELQVI